MDCADAFFSNTDAGSERKESIPPSSWSESSPERGSKPNIPILDEDVRPVLVVAKSLGDVGGSCGGDADFFTDPWVCDGATLDRIVNTTFSDRGILLRTSFSFAMHFDRSTGMRLSPWTPMIMSPTWIEVSGFPEASLAAS
jgi:hypothetical protein